MKKLATLAIVALAACGGGSDSTSPTNNPITNSATVTLSGAATGTFTTSTVAAVWASSNNQGGFTFSVGTAQAATPTAPAIVAVIGFTGEPKAGTYKNTDVGALSSLSVQTSALAFWIATDSHQAAAFGSYTLTISSISNTATVSNGKAYTAHGTLTATLPAVTGTGATGSVTMSVTF